MGVVDLPTEKHRRFNKLKRTVKRGFKKVIPIAVSWAAGAVFPPAGAALYSFLKEKIDSDEIPVKINDDDLKDLCMGNNSLDSLQNKLKKILSEKQGFSHEKLEMVLGTFLRPLNEAINDVMEYIQSYPEQLSYLMEEWREENKELINQLHIDIETGFTDIKNILSNQLDKINLIIRKLSIFERTLDKNFASSAKNIFSSDIINGDNLRFLSKAQLAGIYYNIRSPYDITFNPDLFVKREIADIALEDFLMDLSLPTTTRHLFLVLAGAGMGKTWMLASWAKRLSEKHFEIAEAEFFIPFFFPLKLDLEVQLKVLTGTNSIMDAIDKLKYIREVSNYIPILFLDGLDEIRPDIAEDILRYVILLAKARIPVILSCRDTDWSREERIIEIQSNLRDYCFKHAAGSSFNIRDVVCLPSVYLDKFTKSEFDIAIKRYDIPQDAFFTDQLVEMARYPILLRLFSEYYHLHGKLLDPSNPSEFSPIFLGLEGTPPETNILGRLGIIGTKRDYLVRLIVEFLKKGPKLRTNDLKELISERENFKIIRSAGLIEIEWTPVGAAFKLNPLYLPHLKHMVELAGINIKEKKSLEVIKESASTEISDTSPFVLKDDKNVEKRNKFDYLIDLGKEFLSDEDYENALKRFEKARDLSEDIADIKLTKQVLDLIKNTKIKYEEYKEKFNIVNFRDVKIHKFEAEVLKELESLINKEFQLIEAEYLDVRTGITISNNWIIGLSIFNCDLEILPESISNLKSLKYLALKINKISELPEWIGNLKSLELLNLSVNKLETIPLSIGNLKQLQFLYLNDNQLKELPETIGELKSLERLTLNNNELETVPTSIGRLKNLKKLLLERNKLKILPESIGDLKSLTKLRLDNNQLRTLPESIGNLSSLKKLYLQKNQLENLPESIGNLSSLKELFLFNNHLRTLPESMINLQSLEILFFNKSDEKMLDIKGKSVLEDLKKRGVIIERWV
ncbi:MAG: leucine-rich repeat domain-containing protein [Promethearchaeota archaeon]